MEFLMAGLSPQAFWAAIAITAFAGSGDYTPEGEAARTKVNAWIRGSGVFDGVIETNTGETVGEEGKTLDDATITGGINWYFKTVEVVE